MRFDDIKAEETRMLSEIVENPLESLDEERYEMLFNQCRDLEKQMEMLVQMNKNPIVDANRLREIKDTMQLINNVDVDYSDSWVLRIIERIVVIDKNTLKIYFQEGYSINVNKL